MKVKLDEVLTGLKHLTKNREDCERQETAHREEVKGFEEKLQGSEIRVANAEGQLQMAKNRESKLKEDNDRLRTNIDTVRTQFHAGEDVQTQLKEAKMELQSRTEALQTANSKLHSSVAETDRLKKLNEELKTTMQSLQERVNELEQTINDLVPKKEAIDKHLQEEREKNRAELLKHSEEYCAQLRMEANNQIRKLSTDRDRLEKQVATLKKELSQSKQQVEGLRSKTGEGSAMQEQLDQSKKLLNSQAQEIERLKSTMEELHQTKGADASLTELKMERSKLQKATEEKLALLKRVQVHRHEIFEANKTCKEAQDEHMLYRIHTQSQIEELNGMLEGAHEAQRQARTEQEHLQQAQDLAIETQARDRRELQNLKAKLDERDAELKAAENDAVAFHAKTQKAWDLAVAEHARHLEELREQVRSAQTAGGSALTAKETSTGMKQSLPFQDDALEQEAAATEDITKMDEASTSRLAAPSDQVRAPHVQRDTTPSAGDKAIEPTRPRRKVDRTQVSTLDVSTLPASGMPRSRAREIDSSNAVQTIQDTIIEDSQTGREPTHTADANAQNRRSKASMFSDADVADPDAQDSLSQQPTERVEETQLDTLPSFAAFNQSKSVMQSISRSHTSSPLSSSISLASEDRSQWRTADEGPDFQPRSKTFRSGHRTIKRPVDPNFTIHEDAQDSDDDAARMKRQSSSRDYGDTPSLSQEGQDGFKYQTATPKPNSSSKLVRGASRSVFGDTGRTSTLKERYPLQERRVDTPQAHKDAMYSPQQNSSSPAYVRPGTSRPARIYSTTSGGLVNTQSLESQTSLSQDPRRTGRNAMGGSKRKANAVVAEGYEPDRKKRSTGAAAAFTSGVSRSSLRSATQQSTAKAPTPKTAADPGLASSQSHLRTIGGTKSRTPASRKISKSDEFGARFSQELDRR